MTAPAVTGVYLDPTTGRWNFVVGSEIWGDFDTEDQALAAQRDHEAELKEEAERCARCGGDGIEPEWSTKPCTDCGGTGRDCTWVDPARVAS